MAADIGTVANHIALITKIRDFLMTNAELVGDGQNWELVDGPAGTIAPGTNNAVTLRGPGLADDDDIYVSMYVTEDALNENWRISVVGHGLYIPGQTWDQQPLQSPLTRVACWNQPMNYWLAGDGRHFRLVIQVSTVFLSGVWGFGLPNALDTEYPQPFIAAGCMGGTDNWASQSDFNRFIGNPSYNCAFVLYPDQVWRRLSHYGSTGGASLQDCYISPVRRATNNFDIGSMGITDSNKQIAWAPTYGGLYVPRRLQVKSLVPYQARLFYIDGFYKVAGRGGISAGNVIEIQGEDYLVVQDLYRAQFQDYMLMRLS